MDLQQQQQQQQSQELAMAPVRKRRMRRSNSRSRSSGALKGRELQSILQQNRISIEQLSDPFLEFSKDSVEISYYISKDDDNDNSNNKDVLINLYGGGFCSSGGAAVNDNNTVDDITNNGDYLIQNDAFVNTVEEGTAEERKVLSILFTINPKTVISSPIYVANNDETNISPYSVHEEEANSEKIEFCVKLTQNHQQQDDPPFSKTDVISLTVKPNEANDDFTIEEADAATVRDDKEIQLLQDIDKKQQQQQLPNIDGDEDNHKIHVFECDLEGAQVVENEVVVEVEKKLKGDVIRICVTPSKSDLDEGITINRIDSFEFQRGTYLYQWAIKSGGIEAANGEFTKLHCQPGSLICSFETLLFPGFYDNNVVAASDTINNSVTGTGKVFLQVKDRNDENYDSIEWMKQQVAIKFPIEADMITTTSGGSNDSLPYGTTLQEQLSSSAAYKTHNRIMLLLVILFLNLCWGFVLWKLFMKFYRHEKARIFAQEDEEVTDLHSVITSRTTTYEDDDIDEEKQQLTVVKKEKVPLPPDTVANIANTTSSVYDIATSNSNDDTNSLHYNTDNKPKSSSTIKKDNWASKSVIVQSSFDDKLSNRRSDLFIKKTRSKRNILSTSSTQPPTSNDDYSALSSPYSANSFNSVVGKAKGIFEGVLNQGTGNTANTSLLPGATGTTPTSPIGTEEKKTFSYPSSPSTTSKRREERATSKVAGSGNNSSSNTSRMSKTVSLPSTTNISTENTTISSDVFKKKTRIGDVEMTASNHFVKKKSKRNKLSNRSLYACPSAVADSKGSLGSKKK